MILPNYHHPASKIIEDGLFEFANGRISKEELYQEIKAGYRAFGFTNVTISEEIDNWATINDAHVGTNDVYSQYIGINKEEVVERTERLSGETTIDFKKAFVKGPQADAKATLYVTKDIFSWVKVKDNRVRARRITAVILHEIGHLFDAVATNNFLMETDARALILAVNFVDANSKTKSIIADQTVRSKLLTEGEAKQLSAVETLEESYFVLDMGLKRRYKDLGKHASVNDVNETYADTFATMLGYGGELHSTLDSVGYKVNRQITRLTQVQLLVGYVLSIFRALDSLSNSTNPLRAFGGMGLAFVGTMLLSSNISHALRTFKEDELYPTDYRRIRIALGNVLNTLDMLPESDKKHARQSISDMLEILDKNPPANRIKLNYMLTAVLSVTRAKYRGRALTNALADLSSSLLKLRLDELENMGVVMEAYKIEDFDLMFSIPAINELSQLELKYRHILDGKYALDDLSVNPYSSNAVIKGDGEFIAKGFGWPIDMPEYITTILEDVSSVTDSVPLKDITQAVHAFVHLAESDEMSTVAGRATLNASSLLQQYLSWANKATDSGDMMSAGEQIYLPIPKTFDAPVDLVVEKGTVFKDGGKTFQTPLPSVVSKSVKLNAKVIETARTNVTKAVEITKLAQALRDLDSNMNFNEMVRDNGTPGNVQLAEDVALVINILSVYSFIVSQSLIPVVKGLNYYTNVNLTDRNAVEG